ncbi:MAG: ABC transporter substrate-binding protein [Methanospirillaceae archaeon]|nr:ABC transporter substrate-binding protein [Methanospirillaceae archaeon]
MKQNLSLKTVLLLVITFSSTVTFVSGISAGEDNVIYIGVLLPLSGSMGTPMADALELAVQQINEAGGIGGKPVSLVMRNTQTGDCMTYAKQLAKDPRIRVVIGPYTSDDLFATADIFMKNHKVLVSPTASSDEIFRAFSETGSVWRTISGDGDITSVIMQHIAAHDAESIALLTPDSSYGKTFYDWIPFWAIETGISVTGAEEFSQPEQIPAAIKELAADDPDYLIFVNSDDNSEIVSALDALEKLDYQGNIYLIYPGVDEKGRLTERLGTGSLLSGMISGKWKLQNESVSTTTLPDDTLILMSGPLEDAFSEEFEEISGEQPSGFVPQAYDAVLVASAIMARFTAYPDKSPKHAAESILLKVTGDSLPRTPEGFQTAFDRIKQGDAPIITGATGPLVFKPEGTDPEIPWYGTYTMERGMVIEDPILYRDLTKTAAIEEPEDSSGTPQPDDALYGDFWAVIGALSRDWANYRHQADALTVYQYVKDQGVPDDHIILLVYDDIPYDTRNKKPGEVYHTPEEMEVRTEAEPDYIGDTINKQMVHDVLLGTGGFKDNPLLLSDENATVLLYLSSHGAAGGELLVGKGEEQISPEDFSLIIEKMAEEKKFKRMLVVLESCFSGATVENVNTDNVILLTAASGNETSKSAIYDSNLAIWLSDEFTDELISTLEAADPRMPLHDLYQELYRNVRSSHPTLVRGNSSLNIPAKVFFGGTP